jgi:hypothetical protein
LEGLKRLLLRTQLPPTLLDGRSDDPVFFVDHIKVLASLTRIKEGALSNPFFDLLRILLGTSNTSENVMPFA